MKILIVLLSTVVLCGSVSAQEKLCTKVDAVEAENAVSMLHTWNDIYKFYYRFKHCDDGAIAEGYSNSVVRMFAHRWNKLGSFIKHTLSDKYFYTFALRHIDASTDKLDLEKIIVNSKKHCPKSAEDICSVIGESAKKALSPQNHR